jgi:long-chain acyl-CoA synthetase
MAETGKVMRVPVEDFHMTGSGSVGKPVSYREVRIVNKAEKEVSPGETGELLLRGSGMFMGYYNKPEDTSKVFDGEWFHTGDLFRQD